MTTHALIVAALLAAGSSGSEMVRNQPGRIMRSPRFGHLILDDPGTVAHVYFDGAAIRDSSGNAWSMQGTVPQVAKSGFTPAGAGPFSDSAFYTLGTGSDVLDFSGDFSACIVWSPSTTNATRALAANGTYNTAGWIVSDSQRLYVSQSGGVSSTAVGGNPANGTMSVTCFGQASGRAVLKQNLGSYLQAAGTVTITPATSVRAQIGRYEAGGAGRNASGIIYEAWFSTTTPSDALFTAIMQRAKLRAGITAW